MTSADLVSEALRGADIGTWFDPDPSAPAPATTGTVRAPESVAAVDTLGR